MIEVFQQMPLTFWSYVIFILGAVLGSFANVVILRVPEGQSVIAPRSRCPHCLKMIRFYDNIPILSWFFLRGRCRYCHQKISWRYPFVELLTGFSFYFLFEKFGFTFSFFEYGLFIYLLIICSFIDFDHMILPDIFTLSGIVVGLIFSFFSPERNFLDSLLGILLGGGLLWMVAYLYFLWRKQEGMGGGDIKLLAWIGAVLGASCLPFVIMSASLLGSVVGIVVGMKNSKGMQVEIPFGPYLALGAVLYIFGVPDLLYPYFTFFLFH